MGNKQKQRLNRLRVQKKLNISIGKQEFIKRWGKYRILIIGLLTLILSAYTFNDSAPYLIINCSLGNNIKIYFNTSSADNKIIYDEGTASLTNVSGSQVSGYFERNGEQFQIYFPVFDTPYYRTSNNYTYVYITNVSIIKNHNVRFYRYIDDSAVMFGACAILLFFIFLKRG